MRRINRAGRRELHGGRHNHCFSSPVYREKVRIVNTKLADRYRAHKALAGWHISNEYSGACWCDYCLAAFRAWLKAATPAMPVTTNMMGSFVGLDYWRFTGVCDRMAWDAYPTLHGEESWRQAVNLSFHHDLYRTMKGACRPS